MHAITSKDSMPSCMNLVSHVLTTCALSQRVPERFGKRSVAKIHGLVVLQIVSPGITRRDWVEFSGWLANRG